MTSRPPTLVAPLRVIDDFSFHDIQALRLILRGGSVIDWHRLDLARVEEAEALIRNHEIDLSREADRAFSQRMIAESIGYLRRQFNFKIPKSVEQATLPELLLMASGKGHRQLCACAILKVMQIVQHLEARELLFMLPISDEEVFHLVERKVYRLIGGALAAGAPIVEFIGGRKNRDSLYTKLLSKPDVTAAQIYDKLRFRIVTRTRDDIFPVLNFLQREIVPFNSTIPGQSTNTLIPFRRYCEEHPHLASLLPRLQIDRHLEDAIEPNVDNVFTSRKYRVVHFVVDMPVRLPEEILVEAPPAAWPLGRVIFVQTEFQILDQETDRQNQEGDASHAAYKARQNEAVMRRLEVGNLPHRKPDADED